MRSPADLIPSAARDPHAGRYRSLATLGLTIATALLTVCTDQAPKLGPDLKESELPTGLQVSNPVAASAGSAADGGALFLIEGEEDLVYVSLPTGAAPLGTRAAVKRLGDEAALVVKVEDGGFDAVAVRAGATDSIKVVVTNASGGIVLEAVAAVSPKRPPTVVRTWPPRKKSDTPVNASMVAVFSEPILPATVNDKTVKLFAGQSEIPGTVRLLDGGISVAFTPAANLEPDREYRLVVGEDITDLSGERMGVDVVVGFATGTSLLGPPSRIVVSPDSSVLLAGSTYQFTAKVFDAAGNLLLRPVTWKTSGLDVISISQTGLVTALQTKFVNRFVWADARIEASVGIEFGTGITGAADVVVVPRPGSMEILPSAATLAVGDTLALEVVTRASSDALNERIMVPLTVSNSSPAAASVSVPLLGAIEISPFRTLRALAPGTTRITFRAGGVSASTDITVTAPPAVAAVRVAPATAELAPGETLQLSAWLRDANGTIIQGARPTTWSSSDPAVITVNEAGRITAVGNGTATISATSEGKTGTASISVSGQPSAPLFIEVKANFAHTCGVTMAHDTYCWGRFSEIGKQIKDLYRPTLLPGGLDLASIAPGYSLPPVVCGRSNPGETFCWGYYNSVPYRFAPALTFSDLAMAVDGHACGLATSGGTYCWGVNLSGQLGDGTTTSRPGTPTAVIGGPPFKSVAVGTDRSCGITEAGAAYCWGSNASWDGFLAVYRRGLLGTGDLTNNVIATPSPVAGGHAFARISVGMFHSCGITREGKGLCWGMNNRGSLGDGTLTDRSVPTPVATSLTFTDISAGGFTCALATGGAAYCWGHNSNGGLGVDGEGTQQPVAVQGNLSFSRITVGSLFACGLTEIGRVYCWGDNFVGQLGDGTQAERSMPKPIARPNP